MRVYKLVNKDLKGNVPWRARQSNQLHVPRVKLVTKFSDVTNAYLFF